MVGSMLDETGVIVAAKAGSAMVFGQPVRLVPGSASIRTVNAFTAASQVPEFVGLIGNRAGVAVGGSADIVDRGIAFARVYGAVAAGDMLTPANNQTYLTVSTGQGVIAMALDAQIGATSLNLLRVRLLPAGGCVASRATMVQQDLLAYPIAMRDLRTWDAPATVAPATPANDDLGVVYNTFLTLGPTLESGDLKNAGATTRKTGFEFQVPVEYVAGETIILAINCGMKTNFASQTATIDAQIARRAAPTVDIVATDAQSMNGLVAVTNEFVVTATNVVPGDILDVVLTMEIADTGTATAVIGKVNSIVMKLDVKG